jgi:dolichol-phosphate mannosyltransferase
LTWPRANGEDVLENMVDQSTWQVPAYQKVEFGPKRTKYCVCIPVINEGNKLTKQLQRMSTMDLGVDVIIADGGSTDGSNDPERLKGLNVRTLLIKTGPGKLSAQMRMFFAYALEEGYTGIVAVDGNGKDGVEAIPTFCHALDKGFDFVQGSRYVPGGVEENTPLDRKIGLKLLHAPVVSLAAGFRYTDTTNGFRAFSSKFLVDPRVQPFRDVFDTYNLHYYLAIKSRAPGVSRQRNSSAPVLSQIRADAFQNFRRFRQAEDYKAAVPFGMGAL